MKVWTRLICDKCDRYVDAYIADSHELFDLICDECHKKEIEK